MHCRRSPVRQLKIKLTVSVTLSIDNAFRISMWLQYVAASPGAALPKRGWHSKKEEKKIGRRCDRRNQINYNQRTRSAWSVLDNNVQNGLLGQFYLRLPLEFLDPKQAITSQSCRSNRRKATMNGGRTARFLLGSRVGLELSAIIERVIQRWATGPLSCP